MSKTCCLLRRKIVIGILATIPEKSCGVSDSEMMDVITFDPEGNEAPTVHIKFCPWCGKAREVGGETRITEPPFKEPQS